MCQWIDVATSQYISQGQLYFFFHSSLYYEAKKVTVWGRTIIQLWYTEREALSVSSEMPKAGHVNVQNEICCLLSATELIIHSYRN